MKDICKDFYRNSKNKDILELILNSFREDDDFLFQCNTASNISTPLSVLIRLSKSQDHDVRSQVAMNSAIPKWLHDQFINSSDYPVRICAAKNPRYKII